MHHTLTPVPVLLWSHTMGSYSKTDYMDHIQRTQTHRLGWVFLSVKTGTLRHVFPWQCSPCFAPHLILLFILPAICIDHLPVIWLCFWYSLLRFAPDCNHCLPDHSLSNKVLHVDPQLCFQRPLVTIIKIKFF